LEIAPKHSGDNGTTEVAMQFSVESHEYLWKTKESDCGITPFGRRNGYLDSPNRKTDRKSSASLLSIIENAANFAGFAHLIQSSG
jgi:hypothetical protein